MIIDELFEAPQQCPECGGISFSDLILAEKKDACYHKVKASAKVWPSAYASGRLVQCRKKGAGNYGNKSESVAEDKSNAMVNTASRLANKDDGKVVKLRAAGDKRREDQLKGRDIAKRDCTSKDEWGYLKQGVAESSDQAAVDALIKKHGWSMGRTAYGDLAFTWQGSKYVFYGERMRITLPDDRSISVVWGQKPDWQGRGTNELSFAQAVQKKLLTFDLPIWQALDRGQLTDSQAIQKFKAENERQAREAIAQGVNEASDQTNDSDLNAIKNYARSHYPNLAADPESAFDKWVQRSLMHSNVDDHEMDQKIRRMAAEIASLKTKIQSLKQQANDSADYLDESR